MPDRFGPDSRIRDVIAKLGDAGTQALRSHGYEVGEGFVDVLSQYQSLQQAERTDRLRDLAGLLVELNKSS